jgi:hypothetical protein
MKRPRRPVATWALALLAFGAPALALAHCDDVSPGAYVAQLPDVEIPDHIDESRVEACKRCITGDGGACLLAYTKCVNTDSRCPGIVACLNDSYCWTNFDRLNLTHIPACAVTCFAEGGVSGINEIAVAATPLYVCAEPPGACSSVCVDAPGVDADAGEDAPAR